MTVDSKHTPEDYGYILSQIKFLEDNNGNMTDISWGSEEGVILCGYDAKKLLNDYYSLKEQNQKLREACKVVVNGYETDGMEGMQTRDEIFYKVCSEALKS